MTKKSKIEEQIKELQAGWQRTQADFENYKKRTEAQRQETADFIKADFLTRLAPVMDNFRRAFEYVDTNDPKIAGLKLIEKQLEDILKSEGLEKIDTTGIFDPNLHEAVSHEAHDKTPADHIIAEVESGWRLGDKVIKPSKVRVSKGK